MNKQEENKNYFAIATAWGHKGNDNYLIDMGIGLFNRYYLGDDFSKSAKNYTDMRKLCESLIVKKGLITKTAQRITYCEYSNTIRLMPQNHLVASHNGSHWICDSDSAIDRKLLLEVFSTIIYDGYRFRKAEDIVEKLNCFLTK